MSALMQPSVGGQAVNGSALYSRAMLAVLVAQFLSALADNALLFGALALLRIDNFPAWSAPLLQEFFVGAYILMAPFAGPFADARPKGQVMLLSNLLKLGGTLGMCVGLNPFVAYGLVGFGAAAYSPAKYGILSELVPSQLLVKANGLMESSTIAAILVGAIAGGNSGGLERARSHCHRRGLLRCRKRDQPAHSKTGRCAPAAQFFTEGHPA